MTLGTVPHRTRDVTPGPLSATDTCIVYHVTHFEASRNVILHTRYLSTCVGAGCGRGREQITKAIRCGACYCSIVLNAAIRVIYVTRIAAMRIIFLRVSVVLY
jgi:hypothetical protein